MSLYKAHKPILEIRVEDKHYTVTDWYGSRLWVSIDTARNNTIFGYIRVRDSEKMVDVDRPTLIKYAKIARMKLTNRGQKSKIFMRYRRPTLDVSVQN